ncbi:cytochrome ubiquinol oxidase subunit I [Wohlfahrtiimonas larvae]|uniref:Cytochrome ubiquinol oxidase subunit I n=1 Tax=Wohlfahrtiimonas larvae TaxID=1157986 RepID=A0ABP9MJY9_9GAMM|nr:cytochrome ubiquinol oxidase subunit I [Wohlfahrtiimonas larvae]
MFGLEALDLARIQFAFTVSFHIIFPAITIGLATYLAVLEALWLKTNQPKYINLFNFWSKIFAVNFGMGVVSGVVMAFQFGTHWSEFSRFAGGITGPLLTYEVTTAFFLEAGFLGVMMFGRNKVSKGMHFFATCMVALGTNISMFWILSSNSWMQTPTGYEIIDNQVVPKDWLAVVFNPSFIYRLVHMAIAVFMTTALFIGAVGAWHLLKGDQRPENKTMFSMAMWLLLAAIPLQFLAGDLHGLNTLKHQPMKVAAMEGHWENIGNEPTPLILFAIPDMAQEKNHFEIKIPALASLILTHSLTEQVPALKEVAKEDRPNVPLVFWSFRIMVGLGCLMLLTAVISLYQRKKQTFYTNKNWLRLVIAMGPTGLIAILAGWFVTEVGRQPWVVYGLLRTQDAVSPHTTLHMSISLISFIIVYALVFITGYLYMIKLMKKGVNTTQGAN